MKAMFKFGGFTQFIDLAERKPTIYIPHTPGEIQMSDSQYGDVTAPILKKMEFDYSHEEDVYGVTVWVYKFKGVS